MSRATRRIPRPGHSRASHLGFQVLLKDDQPPSAREKRAMNQYCRRDDAHRLSADE